VRPGSLIRFSVVQIGWLKRVLEALISSGYMARTTRADQAAYEYLP
jgi:hypothetical protein